MSVLFELDGFSRSATYVSMFICPVDWSYVTEHTRIIINYVDL